MFRIRARYLHHLEVQADIIAGYFINLLLFWLVYNQLMGHDVALWENASGGLIFMAVAYIRKYTIRRWFSNLIGRIYERQKLQEQAGES